MKRGRRAVNEEDKQERQEAIIQAALELLGTKPYPDISMNEIAASVGLAKGTVYLYFPTKEALFLGVFEQEARAWFAEVSAALVAQEKPISLDDLARLLAASVAARPHYSRLIALTPLVFEYNIPYDTLHTYKRWLYEQVIDLGGVIANSFPALSTIQATQLILQMYIFVSGLEGMVNPTPVARKVMQNDLLLQQFAPLDLEENLFHLIRAGLRYLLNPA